MASCDHIRCVHDLCGLYCSGFCLDCNVSGWLNRACCHQVVAALFDVSTKAPQRMWAFPAPPPHPPSPHPLVPTANPLLRLSNNSTQKHTLRPQHKHLDHTNEFYFLTADRRTHWMAGANLPPPLLLFLLPPPIATYNPCRGHRKRETQSSGQFDGGIKAER